MLMHPLQCLESMVRLYRPNLSTHKHLHLNIHGERKILGGRGEAHALMRVRAKERERQREEINVVR